jgi:hypothetical protein
MVAGLWRGGGGGGRGMSTIILSGDVGGMEGIIERLSALVLMRARDVKRLS